jgi:hypothetical protein
MVLCVCVCGGCWCGLFVDHVSSMYPSVSLTDGRTGGWMSKRRVGEIVYSRWDKSDDLYYQGKIVKLNKKSRTVDILFDDGDFVQNLPFEFVNSRNDGFQQGDSCEVCGEEEAKKKCGHCDRLFHEKCLVVKSNEVENDELWTCPQCEKESESCVCAECRVERGTGDLMLLPCENMACNAMYHKVCICREITTKGFFECARCCEKHEKQKQEERKTEPSEWPGSSQIKNGYGNDNSKADEAEDVGGERGKLNAQVIHVQVEQNELWRVIIDSNASIRVQQKNVKRPGSKCYERYENYKAAKTADEFFLLGGTRSDFKFDFSHGYVMMEKKEENLSVVTSPLSLSSSSSSSERKRKRTPPMKHKSSSDVIKREKKKTTNFCRTLDAKNTMIMVSQINMKRINSKSWMRFERYKSAKTIQEYLDLGGTYRDLKFDIEHNYAAFAGHNAEDLKTRMCEYLKSGDRANIMLPNDADDLPVEIDKDVKSHANEKEKKNDELPLPHTEIKIFDANDDEEKKNDDVDELPLAPAAIKKKFDAQNNEARSLAVTANSIRCSHLELLIRGQQQQHQNRN